VITVCVESSIREKMKFCGGIKCSSCILRRMIGGDLNCRIELKNGTFIPLIDEEEILWLS
jgi:hypothetical protein